MLQYTAACNGTGDLRTTNGYVSVCRSRRASGDDIWIGDSAVKHIVGSHDGLELRLADQNLNALSSGYKWNVTHYTMAIDATDLVKEVLVLNTYDLDLKRQGTVRIDTLMNVGQCNGNTAELSCSAHGGDQMPFWAVVLISSLVGVILLAGVARLFQLYRRWAVPGLGLVGPNPLCSCCYPFLACVCFYSGDVTDDAFTSGEDNEREMQVIKIIRRSEAAQVDLDGTDVHLQAIEDNTDTGRETIEKRVQYFGYGLIDYDKDLCIKDTIGAGNFGTVSKAVLRRRGHHPGRLVAVKVIQLQPAAVSTQILFVQELIAENNSMGLLEEAKLMQVSHNTAAAGVSDA